MEDPDGRPLRLGMEVAVLRAAVVGLIRRLPAEERSDLLSGLGMSADGFSPGGAFDDSPLSAAQRRVAEAALRELIEAVTGDVPPGARP